MKKMFLYSSCAIAIILMLSVLVVYNSSSNRTQEEKEPVVNIEDGIAPEEAMSNALESVVNEVEESDDVFARPYSSDDVKVVSNYYDYKEKAEKQINALTYYNGTYMQSKGIGYGASKSFDVLAVKDGTVTEVLTDELVGNQITIKHDDNTFSIYQSVTNIKVKEGDTVTVGSVIAKSNTSTIRSDLKNHLYFELVIDGVNVNPEECFK